MTSKFNLTGAKFYGDVQCGDNSYMSTTTVITGDGNQHSRSVTKKSNEVSGQSSDNTPVNVYDKPTQWGYNNRTYTYSNQQ